MGGPLSWLLADLALEGLESKIRNHRKWKNKCDWVRHTDDTCIYELGSLAWRTGKIYPIFKQFSPEIKWTRKRFLDILIICTREDNETTVYRKESASDHYLPQFSSDLARKSSSVKNSQTQSNHILHQPSLFGKTTEPSTQSISKEWILPIKF